MKKLFAFSLACVMLFAFAACKSPASSGEAVAPSSNSDTEKWPTGTFFDDAPKATDTVKRCTINEDGSTYSIEITDISYEDFVKWAYSLKQAGIQPVGSGEYGLDGLPEEGLASYNGETKKYTVISTWTSKDSPARAGDFDLSISFLKKK